MSFQNPLPNEIPEIDIQVTYLVTWIFLRQKPKWVTDSLSTLRSGVEKSLLTTNETVFPAHVKLSVGNACHNAVCSADDATKAETAAVWRLSAYI